MKATKLIAGWLDQLGIETSPTPVTDAKLIDIWYAHDYDLYIWGWGPDPDPDFILSTYTTDQCGSSERHLLLEPRVRPALRGPTRAPESKEERQAIVQEMQQIFYDDVPQIVLWYDNDLQA